MFSIVKYDQVFLKSELDQKLAKDVLLQHSVFFKSGSWREMLSTECSLVNDLNGVRCFGLALIRFWFYFGLHLFIVLKSFQFCLGRHYGVWFYFMEFTNCFSRMFPIILVFFRSTVDLEEDCFDLDFEMASFEFRLVSIWISKWFHLVSNSFNWFRLVSNSFDWFRFLFSCCFVYDVMVYG